MLGKILLSLLHEEYSADLQVGIDALKIVVHQNDEERHILFLLKKRVVDALIERVTINRVRDRVVEICLNLPKFLDREAG